MSAGRAISRGEALCATCGLLAAPALAPACPRCGTRLYIRKPDSVKRAWALLLAAYLLYLPANLLPIMETHSLFGAQQDTILSGVAYLWSNGSWLLALIVFIASIAVPLLKLLSLTFLLVSVEHRTVVQPLQLAKLYRLLELIGRWSMLDVYVVTILVALVQIDLLARIKPSAGLVAFAAVVVLSMLATKAFDPRLIWDAVAPPRTRDSEA